MLQKMMKTSYVIIYDLSEIKFMSCFCFQTLQNHYHPEVSKVAQRINTTVPTEETDLSELLDVTENDVRDYLSCAASMGESFQY